MSALRLVADPVIPPDALYKCEGCSTLCTNPSQGPRRVRQTMTGYTDSPEVLCGLCHTKAWGKRLRDLDVVRTRKTLIEAHREGGWDAVARIVHAGVQIELIS